MSATMETSQLLLWLLMVAIIASEARLKLRCATAVLEGEGEISALS
jgi:hypothetical protein